MSIMRLSRNNFAYTSVYINVSLKHKKLKWTSDSHSIKPCVLFCNSQKPPKRPSAARMKIGSQLQQMLDYDRAPHMNELLLYTMLDGESLKYNVSKSQTQKGHTLYNPIIRSSKPGSTPRAVQVRTMAFHLLKYFQQSRKHPSPFFSILISRHSLLLAAP